TITAKAGDDVTITLRPQLAESIVVSGIRAEAETPVTKTDVSAADVEHHYYGQDIPMLLRDTPSITAYAEGGVGGRGTRTSRCAASAPRASTSRWTAFRSPTPRTWPRTSSIFPTWRTRSTAFNCSAERGRRRSAPARSAGRSTLRACRRRRIRRPMCGLAEA